jgi:uncharacterized protein
MIRISILGFAMILAGVVSGDGFSLEPCHQEAVQKTNRQFFGILDAGGRIFRFAISVDENNSATLTSLDENQQQLKLDDVKLDEKEFSFVLKATRASYQSKFDSQSNHYQGTWSQNGRKLGLSFAEVKKVPAEKPKEIWEGDIQAGFQKLKLRFKVFGDKAAHQVIMDSVTQGVGGFTGQISSEDGKVTFSIPAIRGKFSGTLSDDKSSIKGKWNQGVDLDLELKRITEIEKSKTPPPPKRPQNPKPPFPYKIEEVKIENKSANLVLSATLTIPKTPTPAPCVVLISGSGPQDRDETIFAHKPFWIIADHFTRNGIAVIRFDDRGVGKSTGDHALATTADFSTDVDSIVDYLKTRQDIEHDNIGLCGHSEGGLIAPMVATRRNDIAFLIMMAGPGVNGTMILKNQVKKINLAAGVKPDEMAKIVFLQGLILEAVNQTEDGVPDVNEILETMITKFPDLEKNRDDLNAEITAAIKRISSPWMRFFVAYEPAPALEKLRCRVLAINGTKDTQVDLDLNFSAIRSAFQKAKKTNFELVEFADLNHLFQTCQTGGIGEYQLIEQTIAPEVLKKMTAWVQSASSR